MVLLYMIHFVTNLPIFSFPMGLMKNVEQEALAALLQEELDFLGKLRLCVKYPIRHNFSIGKDGPCLYNFSQVYVCILDLN